MHLVYVGSGRMSPPAPLLQPRPLLWLGLGSWKGLQSERPGQVGGGQGSTTYLRCYFGQVISLPVKGERMIFPDLCSPISNEHSWGYHWYDCELLEKLQLWPLEGTISQGVHLSKCERVSVSVCERVLYRYIRMC